MVADLKDELRHQLAIEQKRLMKEAQEKNRR